MKRNRWNFAATQFKMKTLKGTCLVLAWCFRKFVTWLIYVYESHFINSNKVL